jgi:DNA-binding transcriptional LysR family regulator
MDAWLFQEGGKRFEITLSGTLTTTSGEVVHNWVCAGRGIALKAGWDVQPDLDAGSIVECLKDFWCDEIDLFAICASRLHLFPRIRVFLDFISSTLPKMVSEESRTNLPQSTSKDVPPVTKPRRSPRPDSNRDRLH